MEKKYIIISLKHSTKTETTFWRSNDAGYTTNPWGAGIYDEADVKRDPSYYNDGFNTIAICINNSSMPDSGLKVVLNERTAKQYRKDNLGDL